MNVVILKLIREELLMKKLELFDFDQCWSGDPALAILFLFQFEFFYNSFLFVGNDK